MSPAFRYGLASLVLLVGTASALPFRQAGHSRTDGDSEPTVERPVSRTDPTSAASRAVSNAPPNPAPLDVIPVSGNLETKTKPAPRAHPANQQNVQNRIAAPEIELGFAPIEPDDGWTVVPTRSREESLAARTDDPARKVIPARKTKYLPRAFRRSIDNHVSKHPRYIPQ